MNYYASVRDSFGKSHRAYITGKSRQVRLKKPIRGRGVWTRAEIDDVLKPWAKQHHYTVLPLVEQEPYPDLSGDLDANVDLLNRLEALSRDIRQPLHINFGRRTFAEQTALWNAELKRTGGNEFEARKRVAKPGTSRHETGNAADVVLQNDRSVNIGDVKGVKGAKAKKHGLYFPVPGESWHVEVIPS